MCKEKERILKTNMNLKIFINFEGFLKGFKKSLISLWFPKFDMIIYSDA